MKWPEGYDSVHLRGDLSAGVTVAVLLVPQAMAYAMLAGLPPVMGLYAATFPLLAYAVWGGSRHLAVGPVAIVSLLVAAACSQVAEPGSADYLAAVAMLTMLAGAIQLALGRFGAGFLTHFISHAVVSGFTSAGAIVIGLSQLRHLLGIPLERHSSSVGLAIEIARRAGEAHWPTLGLGAAAVVVLLICKKRWPRMPAALLVTVAGTLLVYRLRLDLHGVQILGAVPGGLPGLTLPGFDARLAWRLFPLALVVVFVGFTESIAVAQWVAAKENYRVDADREFIGLGAANLVAALFSGYAVTGGFSRTAVNYQAGARTRMASVVTAALVLLTLLFLTPLFAYLPKALLAAVIIVAVSGLIDGGEAIRLFKIKPADGWTLVVTFAATLTVGIDQGILTGILFSLVLFVARSSRPRTVVLGYVAADASYRDTVRHPEAVTDPDLILIRVDASLYFANARFVEDRVREQQALKPDARWVVMDMSGVNDIDAVAVSILEDLMAQSRQRGVRFAFAGMKAQVREVVVRAGWHEQLDSALDYPALGAAIRDVSAKENQGQPGNQDTP